MAMKVEILSKEIIKPSSPTPHNLKTLSLSFLDQITPISFVPIVLFYSTTTTTTTRNSDKLSDLLKKSLSETLTHMYPLAGRIKDDFSVDCSDQGIDYIRSRVSGDMSIMLEHPNIDTLRQLLPFTLESLSNELGDHVLLAVRFTEFQCGGTAIAMCVSHRIADGFSIATFLKSWAAISRGEKVSERFAFNHTGIFPPRDFGGYFTKNWQRKQDHIVSKRFVFSGSNIADLGEKAAETIDSKQQIPTRVEAVMAFIWAAAISAARERNAALEMHIMTNVVSVRKRVVPSFPPHTIGNLILCTTAQWEATDNKTTTDTDYPLLVKKIHKSIQNVDNDYVKKVSEDHGDGYLNHLRKIYLVKENAGLLKFTSWCRFGFYEADFGWGRPVWVGNAMGSINSVILMDTKDGEGIEAWVGLPEEDMDKLQQDPEFLSYASVNPSV